MKKLSVLKIYEDQHRDLKSRAAQAGVSLLMYVNRLLTAALKLVDDKELIIESSEDTKEEKKGNE